ncbi:aliphatic sulfonate ABC transporter substrate-binding protein [Terrilactibacillus sp. S3-3]|nr:aliphatic sulfonate ABC transporter substrate-binding protein [Terrilactibacillus sp. S3-3]
MEKNLGKLGYKVTWSQFDTGMAVAEAVSSGAVDVGTLGDAPSLFALGRGLNLTYIAGEPSAPKTEGILATKSSRIKKVSDLKGKKVAFNKASISQYLLLETLKKQGLTLKDVKPVYLNPPEASVAFAKGNVDAWVVWDPFYTVAANQGNTIVSDATGVVSYRSFYIGNNDFVKKNPKVIKETIKTFQAAGKEIEKNPNETAKLLNKATKIPTVTWEKILKHKPNTINFMDKQAVDDLQKQADDFLNLKFINKKLNINDHVWYPK